MVHKTPADVRFWRKVIRGPVGECWPWIGDKVRSGYGRFTPHPKRRDVNGKRPNPEMAHRLAWSFTNGPIPEGLECCHHCDNPPCCNPKHLWLGTHKQNMDDMVKKGRVFHPKGEIHGEAKLTGKQVVEIRSMYRPGIVSLGRLAKVFGVSKRLVLNIVHRRAWSHIP